MRTTASFKSIFAATLFCLFTTASLLAIAVPTNTFSPPKWEKLGQKIVDFKLERDVIYVTAKEGRFTSIRLLVKRAPVNLRKVIVHYANGDKENINVRNKILSGQTTRVIDLKGNKRVIEKVVFAYDTRNAAKKKAVVELWGKH